ncbi:hypothetical protein EBZ39_19705 [bacterium]|nr:hypothetical protein [bacterium]
MTKIEELMFETAEWTIRELTPKEYPDTQLRYEVRDETGEVVSLHFWEEDAKQMATMPLVRRVLFDAFWAYIKEAARDYGITEEDVLNRIIAGLKAAKGE